MLQSAHAPLEQRHFLEMLAVVGHWRHRGGPVVLDGFQHRQPVPWHGRWHNFYRPAAWTEYRRQLFRRRRGWLADCRQILSRGRTVVFKALCMVQLFEFRVTDWRRVFARLIPVLAVEFSGAAVYYWGAIQG